jgi:hypothetical protein
MKKVLLSIREDLSNTPNSVKFWNFMVLIVLVVSGLFSLDLLFFEWLIGSVITFAIVVDGNERNQFWMFFMPLTWGCMLFVGCGALMYLIYKNTILKFNSWLDKNK